MVGLGPTIHDFVCAGGDVDAGTMPATTERSMPDVLRPKPHADDARRQPSQHREAAEQTHRPWRLRRHRATQHTADNAILDGNLHALRHARRELAATLHGAEIGQCRGALPQAWHEDVRRRHRVLDRQVDPDSADR